MGLKCLSKDPTSSARYNNLFDLDSGCDAIAPLASSSCDLIKEEVSGDAENNEEEQIPSAWFTSLWTLQEIMIRPDMIMLDKNWRPLAVGNKLLIALDSLISLAGELSATEDAPKGVATLNSMFYDHHLSLLRTESRLVPLVLGANRVSTSPRAPAIMSAIGATDWFRGRTMQQFQSPEEADQLVLGSYPLDFVEEVRNLCGAEFFSCSTATATLVIDPASGTEPAPGYPLRGTMLPFMPVPDELYQSTFESADSDGHDIDHPSVGSRRIHRDGSVTLPTAAIVASNSISLQMSCKLTCMVESNNPESTSSVHTVQELLPLQYQRQPSMSPLGPRYNWRQRRSQLSSAIRTRSHAVSVRVVRLSDLLAPPVDLECSSVGSERGLPRGVLEERRNNASLMFLPARITPVSSSWMTSREHDSINVKRHRNHRYCLGNASSSVPDLSTSRLV
jgi:hypothetical protein